MAGSSKPFALRLDGDERGALEDLQDDLTAQLGAPVQRGEALRQLLMRWQAWRAGRDPWQAGYSAGYAEGRKRAYAEHKRALAGLPPE